MIKKLIILFKIARKLAQLDALKIASKIHEPPMIVKIFFQILSFSFSNKNKKNPNINEKEKLSHSLQEMGTTFIKLGQFLATRPDIIGEDLSKQLELLQDKLPPFSLSEAKANFVGHLGKNCIQLCHMHCVNYDVILAPQPWHPELCRFC